MLGVWWFVWVIPRIKKRMVYAQEIVEVSMKRCTNQIFIDFLWYHSNNIFLCLYITFYFADWHLKLRSVNNKRHGKWAGNYSWSHIRRLQVMQRCGSMWWHNIRFAMDQKHIRIVNYFEFYVFNLINQYEVTCYTSSLSRPLILSSCYVQFCFTNLLTRWSY